MQQKARMTFRFEPARKDEPPKPVPEFRRTEVEPAAPRTEERIVDKDIGGPAELDADKLEQLIRGAEAKKAIADFPPQTPSAVKPKRRETVIPLPESRKATEMPVMPGAVVTPVASVIPEEPEEPHRGWPEIDESILREYAASGTRMRSEGPSWWKVFASVAGAIATGALFGYLVLTLFAGESPLPSSGGTATETASPAQAAVSSPSASSGAPASAASGAGIAAELPGETYYWLQYGVFRSEESMDAALAELKDKGYPGYGDRTDGYRVYAGAAASKEEAELLAAQMPGLEIFVKSSEIEPVKLAFADTAGLEAFVEQSHKLAQQLAHLSVAALQDELPQPIGESDLASLRDTHAEWLKTLAAVVKLEGPAKDAGMTMAQSLNAAMVSLDDYGKKISRFHLWSVQKDVMEAIGAGRSMRTAVAAGTAK